MGEIKEIWIYDGVKHSTVVTFLESSGKQNVDGLVLFFTLFFKGKLR